MADFIYISGPLGSPTSWAPSPPPPPPPPPPVLPGTGSSVEINNGGVLLGSITVGAAQFDGASTLEGSIASNGATIASGTLTIDDGGALSEGNFGVALHGGAVDLINGTVSANNFQLGGGGSGTFTQGGGTATTHIIQIFEGSYTLSKGTLNVTPSVAIGTEFIGAQSGQTGTFIQTGGDHALNGQMALGYAGGIGEYDLKGGEFSGSGLFIGEATTKGYFDQTGGTSTVSDRIVLGVNSQVAGIAGPLTIGTGQYDLGGAAGTSLTVGTIFDASDPNCFGTFNFNIKAGDDAVLTVHGDPAKDPGLIVGGEGIGVFNQATGTLTIDLTNSSNIALQVGRKATGDGTYNLSGGALATVDDNSIIPTHDAQEIIGDLNKGLFDQTGGTNTVDGALVIGNQGGSNGHYVLGGDEETSLTADGLDIGVQAGATGLLSDNQQAGDSAGMEIGPKGSLLGFTVGDAGTGTVDQKGDITVDTDLSVGAAVTGNGTYNLQDGGLTVKANNTVIIGDLGMGVFNQTGGTATFKVDMTVGNQGLSNGRYNLGGDKDTALTVNNVTLGADALSTGQFDFDVNKGDAATLTLDDKLTVGDAGTGAFNQGGGNLALDSDLEIGHQATGNGTYTLTGGALKMGGVVLPADELVGDKGLGEFDQFGGTNTTAGTVWVGYDKGALGSYVLSGPAGTTLTADTIDIGALAGSSGEFDFDLNPGDAAALVLTGFGPPSVLIVGDAGTGAMLQAAGVIKVGSDLEVGQQAKSDGDYELTGGALTVGPVIPADMYVGDAGTGLFKQTGGTVLVNGNAVVGNQKGADGTYTLAGLAGTGLTADTLAIGAAAGATGVVNFDLAAGAATIKLNGAKGSPDLVVGDAGTGTLNQGGGAIAVATDLSLGAQAGAKGTVNLSGGALNVGVPATPRDLHVGALGTGTFNQTGGTSTVSGKLLVGDQATGVGKYGLGGAAGGLTANTIVVGNAQGAAGTMNYDLNPGDAATLGLGAKAGVTGLTVGADGTGTFSQGGGVINTPSDLSIGAAATGDGTYNLSGGALTAANEIVGDLGTGQFVQTKGANTTTAALIVGKSSGGDGTYTLGGPASSVLNAFTLTVGALKGANGTFNFDTGNGDAAVLTATAPFSNIGLTVGGGGTGVFNQGGGALTVAANAGTTPQLGTWDLAVGYLAGSTGTYNLSGGTLTAAYAVIGNQGHGTFTETGGAANFGVKGVPAQNQLTTLSLGDQQSSQGVYTLTGASLSVFGNAIIGNVGQGSLQQNTGTQTTDTASFSGTLTIGNGYNSVGTYSMSGTSLTVSGVATIGAQGNGTFTEVSGKATFSKGLVLAALAPPGGSGPNPAPSAGFVNLTTGILVSKAPSVIGDTGQGTFTQTGGVAQFLAPTTAAALIVGGDPSANPGAGLGGGTGIFTLGSSNTTSVLVVEATNAQSKIVDGTVEIGANGGVGTFNFNMAAGDAATIENAGVEQSKAATAGPTFQVGVNGTGTLNQGGGTLALSDLQIATNTGAGTTKGSVSVSGAGAQLMAAGLEVGSLQAGGGGFTGGMASLTISGGAHVMDDAALAAGKSTTLNFDDGVTIGAQGAESFQGAISITGGGSLEIGGHAGAAANTLQVDASGALVGHGLIDSSVTGTTKLAGGGVVSNYSLAVADAGAIEALGGPLVIHGTVTGAGSLKIDAGATLEIAGPLGAQETITFAGANATLIVDDPLIFKAQIAGFQAGDRIDYLHTPVADDFTGAGQGDVLIENTNGAVVLGVAGAGNQETYSQVSALGSEWTFRGTGDFLGDAKADFLIQNTSGSVVVGEVSGGQAAYTQVAALGPEWSFVAAGDFLADTRSDFLIENTSGAVVVGEVTGGQAAYTVVGALGSEWSFKGAGDFLGDGHDQFLIENTNGSVVIGDVVASQAQYAQVSSLGPEWSFRGDGDFLGDGKADFLIENSSGGVVVGEVVNGQASFTQIAALGPEWVFKGVGDFLGEGHDQFLIENTNGSVVVGDWTGGQIHYTQVSALGSEWAFHL